MLDDVVPFLVCPNCAGDLEREGAALRCPRGHSFDVAKQGYVALGPLAAGDTAEMVAARSAFLDRGHYAPLVDALIPYAAPGLVIDAGAGTGFYLKHVLTAGPGLALDSSKAALKRAAKAHHRIGAVACDLWRTLPVRDACADLVLNVFAPRNPAELRRVVKSDGLLVVAAPTADHLRELVSELDLLTVDADKQERIDERLAPHFAVHRQETRAFTMDLDHADIAALVGMGPNAFHTDAQRDARIAALAPRSVTASVTVTAYRPRRGDHYGA